MQTYDPHKNTTEVRQGNKRTTNLRVLIIALVGIVVAFGLIYFFYASQTPPSAL
jgi:hypothetical protein